MTTDLPAQVPLSAGLGVNFWRSEMFAWLKRLYGGEQNPTEKESAIAPGQRWQFVTAADPWGPKNYRPVRILDVRDGWVRYDIGGLFRDERQTVNNFVRMYRRVDA